MGDSGTRFPARSFRFVVLAILCVSGLSGCNGDGVAGTLTIFDQDTVIATLTVGAADVVRTQNGAVVTVTGDATIDGRVEAEDGPLHLRVQGDLVVNGAVVSVHANPPIVDPDTVFRNLGLGIFIVALGDVTLGPNASVTSNGPLVVTDTDGQLDRTSRDAYDETDSTSGSLPTLVPLPPDDPVFGIPFAGGGPSLAQAAPPITIRGRWDLSGMMQPNFPVMLFRFNGTRPLDLDNWTLIPPQTPAGDNKDETANPGGNANGGNGRRGANLNIWNNGGPINIVNTVTLNLADGSDGGTATSVCATATGGDGGKSGNFRMTAAGGIDITSGQLVINPGKGGNGGAATVNKGAAGPTGCPGGGGADATATGGNGAENRKRIFVRGNVQGLANITVGALTAGDGGPATATACDGGPGLPCCAGGKGGAATATGGAGGEASLNLGGFGLANTGGVNGGKGGNATATGGTGGAGGPCKFGDGGGGGMGGDATATSGDGGDATASGGGGGAAGGNAGTDATATSGMGGTGGASGFGTPGTGGPGGTPTATSGTPGAPGGTPANTNSNNPGKGPDGGTLPTVFFCIPTAPLVAMGDPLSPGPILNHPVENQAGQPIGNVDLELTNDPGAQYRTSNIPADHIGIQGGAICFDLNSLGLTSGTPGPVIALQLVPLQGQGIDDTNPLLIELANAQGEVLHTIPIASIPDNSPNPTMPETIDVDTGMVPNVAKIYVRVPPVAFVTFFRFYLIDP